MVASTESTWVVLSKHLIPALNLFALLLCFTLIQVRFDSLFTSFSFITHWATSRPACFFPVSKSTPALPSEVRQCWITHFIAVLHFLPWNERVGSFGYFLADSLKIFLHLPDGRVILFQKRANNVIAGPSIMKSGL